MDPVLEVAILAGVAAVALTPIVVAMVLFKPAPAPEPERVVEPPAPVAIAAPVRVAKPPRGPRKAEPDIEDFASRLWSLGITEIESIAQLAAMYEEYAVEFAVKPLTEKSLAMRVGKARGIKRYRDGKSPGNPTRYRVTPAAAMKLVKAA